MWYVSLYIGDIICYGDFLSGCYYGVYYSESGCILYRVGVIL
jgi:hypothetical protein